MRLTRTATSPGELLGAVDRLLADDALARAAGGTLSAQLQAAPGTARAADLIEQLT